MTKIQTSPHNLSFSGCLSCFSRHRFCLGFQTISLQYGYIMFSVLWLFISKCPWKWHSQKLSSRLPCTHTASCPRFSLKNLQQKKNQQSCKLFKKKASADKKGNPTSITQQWSSTCPIIVFLLVTNLKRGITLFTSLIETRKPCLAPFFLWCLSVCSVSQTFS